MNHKVNSVANLYSSAEALQKNIVRGSQDTSAATIIHNLKEGIDNLEANWEGHDAGIQINNVVTVYNAMTKIKEMLDSLAVEASKISSDYRAIQKANGANNLEELAVLREEAPVAKLAEYTDTRDTINITPGATTGKNKIDAASNAIDGFIADVRRNFDDIMNNWTAGPKREEAKQVFEEFVANSKKYKELLNETSTSVATSLKNYDRFGNNNMAA